MDDLCQFVYFLVLVTLPRVSHAFVRNMTAFLNIGPFYLFLVLLRCPCPTDYAILHYLFVVFL